MMQQVTRFILSLFITTILVSCAATEGVYISPFGVSAHKDHQKDDNTHDD